MSETGWIRSKGGPTRAPGFREGTSWKERPIDVRAEAARQVGSERRGQLWARRVDAYRGAKRNKPAPRPPVFEADGSPEPPIRRQRKNDPGFPSSWYRWRGERGRAYIEAWVRWTYGLGSRPPGWREFQDRHRGNEGGR